MRYSDYALEDNMHWSNAQIAITIAITGSGTVSSHTR
jgi:hypothetical protein